MKFSSEAYDKIFPRKEKEEEFESAVEIFEDEESEEIEEKVNEDEGEEGE